MSQEFMPAPTKREVSVSQELSIHPSTPEHIVSLEREERYSNRFLGILMTPDLNPDVKIKTFLPKPISAYKAIERLWDDKRKEVRFPAGQLDEKVKEWADARAKLGLDLITMPTEEIIQPKKIFGTDLGFVLDENKPKEEQIKQFSEYLAGPFYTKYCGQNGIENLAEVLSTHGVRALHDFLAPILGGEEQFQRLEACQLALYRNSGKSRHPLLLEVVNSETLSSDEKKLLDPMREKVSISANIDFPESNFESTSMLSGEASLMEQGETYTLNEIFADRTADKNGPELNLEEHPLISIEEAMADTQLMNAMVARGPLLVIVADERGLHQNDNLLSLKALTSHYGTTNNEHSYMLENCMNSLIAAVQTHPEMVNKFIDVQKQARVDNLSEANYIVIELRKAYQMLAEEYTGFPQRDALKDYISYNDIRKKLGIIQRINEKAGKTEDGKLPTNVQNMLAPADLTDALLKELHLDDTDFTAQTYQEWLTTYPAMSKEFSQLLPIITTAVNLTRDTQQKNNERFSLGIRINNDPAGKNDLSLEIDKEFTLNEIFPVRLQALKKSMEVGKFTLGNIDFAELLSDIYDIKPVVARVKGENLDSFDTVDHTLELELGDLSSSIPVEQPQLVPSKENDDSLPIQEVIEMKVGDGNIHIMHGDVTYTSADALVYSTDRKFAKVVGHDPRPDEQKAFRENQWEANEKIASAAGEEPFAEAQKYYRKNGRDIYWSKQDLPQSPFLQRIQRYSDPSNFLYFGTKSVGPLGTTVVFDAGNLKERGIQKLLFSFIADDDTLRKGALQNRTLYNLPELSKILQRSVQHIFEVADANGITSVGMPILGLSFLGSSDLHYENAITIIASAYKNYQQEHIARDEGIKVKDVYLVANEKVDQPHIQGSLSVMQTVAKNLQK